MTEYLSRKLKVLSALLILMVVYIHCSFKEGASLETLVALERIIGGRICRVAVPLFYIISGYLFFLKVPDGLKSIGGKLRKRNRTLLIPYLLANIICFLFIVLMNFIINEWPEVGNVWTYPYAGLLYERLIRIIYTIFVAPIAYQLWFVRDLMIIMLFTPLIYKILKKTKTSRIIQALFIIALGIIFLVFNRSQSHVALVWFNIGAIIATCYQQIATYRKPRPLLTFILLLIFLTYSILCGLRLIVTSPNLAPVLGIPTLWLLYDVAVYTWPKLIRLKTTTFLCSYTFFVYLCHEPLLNIFKNVLLLISNTEGYLITLYLLIPPIFYILASLLGAGLKSAFPKAYAVYTGGR